jgi:hypothetical protein
MTKRVRTEAVWDSYGEAIRLFVRGVTFPSAARIALVVGTWLSLVNQGSAIVDGDVPWAKVVLNYLTPFVVASLGYLAARRRRSVERLSALVREPPPREGGGA